MLFIPVIPETLDMLEELNNGVRPQIEEGGTYFLYENKDTPPKIVSIKEFEENHEIWSHITVEFGK